MRNVYSAIIATVIVGMSVSVSFAHLIPFSKERISATGKHCVHGYDGNFGAVGAYYAGETAVLNEQLGTLGTPKDTLGATTVISKTVVLHPGPMTVPSYVAPEQKLHTDWLVQTWPKLKGGPTGMHLQVDIWLGGGVSLDELQVPPDFSVKSGGEIDDFIKRQSDKANTKNAIPEQREQIGAVLGKPLYRDQIQGKNLPDLVFAPVRLKYLNEHKAELTPTSDEVEFAARYFEQTVRNQLEAEGGIEKLQERMTAIETQLNRGVQNEEEKQKLELERGNLRDQMDVSRRSRFMAFWALTTWKGQKHIYEKYGGGRMLIGKFGHEAFDASRKQLETLEAAGWFTITDPEAREYLYQHWSRDHGNRLNSNDAEIRKWLLEPEYVAIDARQ